MYFGLLAPGLNASQGGGGFYGGNQSTPSTGEKRRQRAQNLVPVRIQDILESRDEQFQVEGMEVGMVTFCGVIDSVDHQVFTALMRSLWARSKAITITVHLSVEMKCDHIKRFSMFKQGSHCCSYSYCTYWLIIAWEMYSHTYIVLYNRSL